MTRPVWSERRWHRVWEQQLDAVERHDIAVDVWHRRLPDDPEQQPIAVELARRWRRSSRNVVVIALVWTAFWTMIVRASDPADGSAFGLSVAMSIAGVLAIAAALVVRHRLVALARDATPDTAPDTSTG